jgi:hypothetical protein
MRVVVNFCSYFSGGDIRDRLTMLIDDANDRKTMAVNACFNRLERTPIEQLPFFLGELQCRSRRLCSSRIQTFRRA